MTIVFKTDRWQTFHSGLIDVWRHCFVTLSNRSGKMFPFKEEGIHERKLGEKIKKKIKLNRWKMGFEIIFDFDLIWFFLPESIQIQWSIDEHNNSIMLTSHQLWSLWFCLARYQNTGEKKIETNFKSHFSNHLSFPYFLFLEMIFFEILRRYLEHFCR